MTNNKRPATSIEFVMKINLRWLVQAVSLVLGVYLFMRLADTSKTLLLNYSIGALLAWSGLFLVFAVCFFLLIFTSYLKQRGNKTLKNPVAAFERLVLLCGLDDLSETNEVPQEKRKASRKVGSRAAEHTA